MELNTPPLALFTKDGTGSRPRINALTDGAKRKVHDVMEKLIPIADLDRTIPSAPVNPGGGLV